MNLAELVSAMPGIELLDADRHGPLSLRDIVTDSRQAGPGCLFVALRGHQRDGQEFLAQVAHQGAVAALVACDAAEAARDRVPGLPLVIAQAPRAVLGLLADRFFGEPSRALQVLGVTGTNGKTTCSALLASILEAAGLSVGVVGTIGYRWPGHREPAVNTTPESLTLHRMMDRMRRAGVQAVVMEVSSHGLASHRVEGVRFDGALFTNLTQDHLDFHGTMEAYFAAKASLFERLLPWSASQGKPEPVAALNLGDRWIAPLRERVENLAAVRVVGFSTEPDQTRAEVRPLEQPRLGLDGLRVRARTPKSDEGLELWAPLVGAFNLENVLGAVALAGSLEGVSTLAVEAGLASLGPVPGRLQRIEGPEGGPAVFVDYAHTPDALRVALAALRDHVPRGGRLVAVFGCGGERDRGKRPQMGRAAWEGADRLVLTSDNPRGEKPEEILEEILAGLPAAGQGAAEVEPDRERAIRGAVARATAADVILVAGKGHENYQEIGGERRHFDDVEVARRALRDQV